MFSDFLLFNTPVPINSVGSPLSEHISQTKSITLNHLQSIFTIKFVALNYIIPQKNQYAYKLEGFEENWNYVGNKQEATYTNLDPGEYTFRVIAANNDGYWNQQGTSIKIVVLPPWWNTWWFSISFILVIILIPLAFYFNRIYSLKNQKILI